MTIPKNAHRRRQFTTELVEAKRPSPCIAVYVSPAFGLFIDRVFTYHLALYAEGLAAVEIRPLTERNIEQHNLTGASALFLVEGREVYRVDDETRQDAGELVERFRLEINNLNTQE